MKTKLVLLGTGTPNACPFASGPAVSVVVGSRAYLVDFGPGIVRMAAKAYALGQDALRPDKLDIAFCTHLHSDHTAGLPDLLLTPWVLERKVPLSLYGPRGLENMASHIKQAYAEDISFRINGFEKANASGCEMAVHEIHEGRVYEDSNVLVNAIKVSHGELESYAYKFVTDSGAILISGDSAPISAIANHAKDVDILLHEAEYSAGLASRDPKWQKYHQSVHTMSTDLGALAAASQPKLLVTYHRIYHMNIHDNEKDIAKEVKFREGKILEEIAAGGFKGKAVNGHDLDVFEI